MTTEQANIDAVMFNSRIYVDLRDIELAMRKTGNTDGAFVLGDLHKQMMERSLLRVSRIGE